MAFAHVLLASAGDGIAAPAGHVAIEIELSVVLVSGFWFRNRRLWLRGRRGCVFRSNVITDSGGR